MTIPAKTATMVETLVDYDGPQVVLLESNRKRHMLGIAVGRDGMDVAFFGCETKEKTYEKYFEGTADLHYVFRQALGSNYYFFDLGTDGNEKIKLVPANSDEVEEQSNWPQIGFFSRSHTSLFNRLEVKSTVRTFKIDGKWEARDFSHFHGKMSDLYALFGVLNRLDGVHSATERGFIRKAVRERFWKGGGSYLGFYDSLMVRNQKLKLSRLEIAKIRYASPGEIEMRGNKKALSDIQDILDLFDEHSKTLAEMYRGIHSTLRKERLLSAKPSAEFSSKAMRQIVKKQTDKFAAQMCIEKVDVIYSVCGKNVLVFAKVILSIYRRSSALHLFHAEGRIQRAD